MDTMHDHDWDRGNSNWLYSLQGSPTVPIWLMQPAKLHKRVLMSTFLPLIPERLDNLYNKEYYGPIGAHQSLVRVNRVMKSWPKRRYEVRYSDYLTIIFDMWLEWKMLRPTILNWPSGDNIPTPLSVYKLTVQFRTRNNNHQLDKRSDTHKTMVTFHRFDFYRSKHD
jgi:hypothetical protein